MPRAASVPAEDDLLCRHCGYTLNGLPNESRCPECGNPIADSTTNDGRQPPAWETRGAFWQTTRQIILQPATFFRSLTTRGDDVASSRFANRHNFISSMLLGFSTALHIDLFWDLPVFVDGFLPSPYEFGLLILPPIILAAWFALTQIARLATFLTRVEGRYWGYRLPEIAVRRAMHYHAAQLLPVAIASFVFIAGYRVMYALKMLSVESQVPYLYTLSGLVVLAALHLFRTYWIAMKNIMYANR